MCKSSAQPDKGEGWQPVGLCGRGDKRSDFAKVYPFVFDGCAPALCLASRRGVGAFGRPFNRLFAPGIQRPTRVSRQFLLRGQQAGILHDFRRLLCEGLKANPVSVYRISSCSSVVGSWESARASSRGLDEDDWYSQSRPGIAGRQTRRADGVITPSIGDDAVA